MPTPKVDQNKCIGCGLCVTICPKVFKLEDDAKSHVISKKITGCNIKEAIDSCPVGAISLG
jgi:ferredoxin